MRVPSPCTLRLLENGISRSMVQDTLGIPLASTTEMLECALRELGLLIADEFLVGYEDLGPWRIGGAETYVAIGQLIAQFDQGLRRRRFIAKAVVTFPTAPMQAIEAWLKRFNVLTALGVPCPHIYSVHKGVLYQEFLEYSLEEAWQKADYDERGALSQQLALIAGVFDACGFQPLAFCRDTRVRDNTLFVVDVGADTGSWNFSRPVSTAYNQWRRSEYTLDDNLSDLDSAYQKSFSRAREGIATLLQSSEPPV